MYITTRGGNWESAKVKEFGPEIRGTELSLATRSRCLRHFFLRGIYIRAQFSECVNALMHFTQLLHCASLVLFLLYICIGIWNFGRRSRNIVCECPAWWYSRFWENSLDVAWLEERRTMQLSRRNRQKLQRLKLFSKSRLVHRPLLRDTFNFYTFDLNRSSCNDGNVFDWQDKEKKTFFSIFKGRKTNPNENQILGF